MLVLAISGYKGSGKDTVATYLKQQYGIQRAAFADVLKDMVSKEYGVPRDALDDPERKELPLLQYPVEPKDKFTEMLCDFMRGEFREYEGKLYWTPRALAILKGSVNRSVTSKFWVQRIIDYIKHPDIKSAWSAFSISDVRYKSEIAQLREAFGDKLVTVRINRFDHSPSVDPSERDLDNETFDFTIENRGTLEELKQNIERVMKLLK